MSVCVCVCVCIRRCAPTTAHRPLAFNTSPEMKEKPPGPADAGAPVGMREACAAVLFSRSYH